MTHSFPTRRLSYLPNVLENPLRRYGRLKGFVFATSTSPPTPKVVLTTKRPSVSAALPILNCNRKFKKLTGSLIFRSALPSPSRTGRSEEHTSELQSLMRISYAVFCLKKKNNKQHNHNTIVLMYQ